MPEYDMIIRGGTIVDGTLAPRYVSDIAIKDGRIVQIGGLRGKSASKVLDASGLIVAPGFVDLHTHYDGQIYWDPYCTLSGWHGVTSVAIGNCGFGFAPCRPADQDRAMLSLTRNEAIPFEALKLGMPWDWVTFPEFLNSLDRLPKGVNVLSYVPLTPLYGWVMGWEQAKQRRPNEKELNEMLRLVHEGMDVGACGWSAQVSPVSAQRDYDGQPMITDLMTEPEIIAFAQLLGERDQGYVELTTSYGQPLYEKVAAASGRPVIFQVVKPSEKNPETHRDVIRWLAESNRKGLRIYGQGSIDRGPYEITFDHWNMFDESPGWQAVTLGTPPERKVKMQDPQLRAALRAEWDRGERAGSHSGAQGSLDALVINRVPDSRLDKYLGRKIGEIAATERKHVVDAVLDLAVAGDLRTEFKVERGCQNPDLAAEVMRSPHVVPGVSDGGAHLKFGTRGSFPTDMLVWLVREHQLLSLEEAHFKLSYLPAFCGGFRDRGFLREGAAADILVYDLEKLSWGPTEVAHDLPGGDWRRIRRPGGYRWTIVNGAVTFEDQKPTGVLTGKLLRHGRG